MFHYKGLVGDIYIGLTCSLSTSKFSEMIKNMHVFLVKGVNSLMSSRLGSPMKNIGWFYSNSLSRTYVQQIKNGALIHTVHSVTIDYTLFDFVDHPIFQASY